MLKTMHNVVLYFITLISKYYMWCYHQIFRADERLQCIQLVNCQLTEPNYRKCKTLRKKDDMDKK